MANNYGSLEGTMDANGILGGEIQFNGAGGKVKDVQVNDVSVVDANGIAKIDLTDYAKTEDIPTDIADLQDDADHRTVTDTEKTEWSGKSNVSANPSTTTETLTGIEIDGTAYAIPSGDVTDVKVNDTSVVDENGVANIDLTDYAEKSDLGTASALDVAVSGDASTSQVVKGDDTRLTDARPASDVSSWAKASTKPDYTASEVGAIATTAKGTANGVAELDENGKVPSAQLPSYVDDVLEYASVSVFPATGESGKIYIALDTNKTYRWSGTTYTEISESLALGETDSTAYAGNKGKQNADNIAAIQGLIPSSATTSNKLATASDIPDISGKADKSEMSVNTSGDQTTIQLKSGTSATVLNAHQSITGKADKVTNATENNFAALDANGNLKDSGHKHSDYLTQHQDISGKADKVSSATNGNLAGLDGNGNLTDAGWSGDKTTTNASGNPISISGLKSNQLAINPIITLEPIQAGSGTPSPSNIRAISGYDKVEVLSCGKNLLQKPFVYYDDITRNKANSFLIGAGTYIFSFVTTTATSWRFCVSMFNEDGNALTDTTYCPNSDMQYNSGYGGWINKGNRTYKEITLSIVVQCYIRITFCVGDTSSSTTTTNAQLEQGNQATTYEAPNKTTSISESLGQTVYGGSLDVRTGMLTVDRQIVDLGDFDWTYVSDTWMQTNITDIKNDGVAKVVCENYATTNATTWNNMEDKSCGSIAPTDVFRVKDTAYNNANTFKTAMSGVQLVYELATPFTIQLTPHEISLLKDYAYVSTNGTSIALDYHNGELASLSDVSQLGETINELGDCIQRTPIDVTAAEGFTVNYNASYRIGDVVYLTLLVSTTTAVTARTTCCTISDFACPKGTVRFVCAAAETHNSYLSKISTGFIQNNGTVRVGDNNPNAKDFAITICYVI